jgi:hypothetical protein
MPEGEYKYALDVDMDSPHRKLAEARNEEINRLLGERQALLDQGKKTEDPGILSINNRLMELTGSRAASNFAKEKEDKSNQVERESSEASKADKVNEILDHVQSWQDDLDREFPSVDQTAGVEATDVLPLVEMERRNELLWQGFVTKDFAPSIEGMADKFKFIRDTIEEYKYDIKLCRRSLSKKRQEYYHRQIEDLDDRINHYLSTREANSSYDKLLSISKIIFPFFEDYKHLHYSCVHEASKKAS